LGERYLRTERRGVRESLNRGVRDRCSARLTTCTAGDAQHVPGFLSNAGAIKAKGVDTIACMSVNDAFVMGAWAKDQGTGSDIEMLADGSADLTKQMGIELDLGDRGLGLRCRRFSMVVDDGVVKELNLEEGGALEISGAETILEQL